MTSERVSPSAFKLKSILLKWGKQGKLGHTRAVPAYVDTRPAPIDIVDPDPAGSHFLQERYSICPTIRGSSSPNLFLGQI